MDANIPELDTFNRSKPVSRLISLNRCSTSGAPKVHEELHGQQKWMKEWRQVGRHLQVMGGKRGDRIS